MTEILKLIENDSRLTPEKIALMLDKEVGDIKNMIAKYERDGVILGYKTLIDWDKTDKEHVSALIELKSPRRETAATIMLRRKSTIIPRWRAYISCLAALILPC